MNVADPLLTWCYGAGVGKYQILAVGTGNGFQSRTAGYARKRLHPVPRTRLKMLLQHAVKLRHLGSANVAVLPEGGRTAN